MKGSMGEARNRAETSHKRTAAQGEIGAPAERQRPLYGGAARPLFPVTKRLLSAARCSHGAVELLLRGRALVLAPFAVPAATTTAAASSSSSDAAATTAAPWAIATLPVSAAAAAPTAAESAATVTAAAAAAETAAAAAAVASVQSGNRHPATQEAPPSRRRCRFAHGCDRVASPSLPPRRRASWVRGRGGTVSRASGAAETRGPSRVATAADCARAAPGRGRRGCRRRDADERELERLAVERDPLQRGQHLRVGRRRGRAPASSRMRQMPICRSKRSIALLAP